MKSTSRINPEITENMECLIVEMQVLVINQKSGCVTPQSWCIVFNYFDHFGYHSK